MKVEMKTLQAGPDGIRRAGQIYTVSAETGKQLIAAGAAVMVEDDHKPAPEIERAVEPVEQETTAAPAAKKASRRGS